MAKAPNILPLKVLVISLGFVLVGGTVFVVSVVVDKVNRLHSPACNHVNISLGAMNVKGTVNAITSTESTLQVTVTDSATSQLLTLDRCTGKLLQQVTITP